MTRPMFAQPSTSRPALELYQGLVLEHARRPHNRRQLARACHCARGDNPLCGDQIDVCIHLENERIGDIAFSGVSCAIATASASMMTQALAGRNLSEARQLAARFAGMIGGAQEPGADLGELAALAEVRRFPARVQCATLAWQALDALLRKCDAA